MSQQPDPTVLPPRRGDVQKDAAPATSSILDSVGSVFAAAPLSVDKTPNHISPAEAGVATSAQPDSPRCALRTSPHLGNDISSARTFASSDTRDHPTTAQHEDHRSMERNGTELQNLNSGEPPMAFTGKFADQSHGEEHAVPKFCGDVFSTSVPAIRFPTSAQMLPPPPGPSNKSKSIWAPGWVQQPEEVWKERLRLGSNAPVSPRTVPIEEAGAIAQPNIQLAGPSNSLQTQNVDEKVQKVGSRSEDAETEYPPPKVALMAYLDRLTKEKAERGLRTCGIARPDNPGERLTEPVCPPVKRDTIPGRKRVTRTCEQLKTDTDGDLAEQERGLARDCQPGFERTTYPILPSFGHMLESAGLTNDELPPLPWETPDSSRHEQSVFAPTGSRNHYCSAASLLEQRSRTMSATNREMVDNHTNDETTLERQRQIQRQIQRRAHTLATSFNHPVTNPPEAQSLSTNTNRKMEDNQVSPPSKTYPGLVMPFSPPLLDRQEQLRIINAQHRERMAILSSIYGPEQGKPPPGNLLDIPGVPSFRSSQPSDSSTTMQLQHAASTRLEGAASSHRQQAPPTHLQHAAPNHVQQTSSTYLERYAPTHIQQGAPTHLQQAASAYLELYAPARLQHPAPHRSSDGVAYFDKLGFESEAQDYLPGFGLESDRSRASYGRSAHQSSLPGASQAQGQYRASSPAPKNFSYPSYGHSGQKNSGSVASQAQGDYHASSLAPQTSLHPNYGHSAQQISGTAASQAQGQYFASSPAPKAFSRPSYSHSAQQSSGPVASQAQGDYHATSLAPQTSLHPNYLQSLFSQVQPLRPSMQQEFVKPSAPPYTGLHKRGRTELEASQPQSDSQRGYGVAYGQEMENLTRIQGQDAFGNALRPNMQLDYWDYGQRSITNLSLQTKLQTKQPYGDGSLGGTSQPNPAHPIQVSGSNPLTNYQTQGMQSQQHSHTQPVVHGKAKNSSTRRSQGPAAQVPLYGPPDWDPVPGPVTGSQTMQYMGGSSQQPQQQAPYGPTDAASRPFTVSTTNQAPAPGPNVQGPVEPRYNYLARESMPLAKRIRHYRPGQDAMYPHPAPGASVQYQALTCNGQPNLEVAMQGEAMPFVEASQEGGPADWGVVKVGNIPYTVTKQEIMAFLGRNAKIITPDLGVAIHIIMERSTSKTMDCFVEFLSYGDALAVVNKFTRSRDDGRHPRVGERHVAVEMSSQDALMKELFPRAKNVVWKGGNPVIVQSDEPYNSGFKSFLTSEELVMLVKHAEQPHRSPFSQKCQQRTYESLISTLEKYPWWCTHLYTVADRDLLFGATEQQIRALVTQLKRGGAPGLKLELLADLVYAGLNASGFSEVQRVKLVVAAESVVQGIRISPLAASWPFEALSRRAGVQEDVVEYYAGLLREATTSTALVSLAARSGHGGPPTGPSPFGNITVPWPTDKGRLTMAVAARLEWTVLATLLRHVLGGGAHYSTSG